LRDTRLELPPGGGELVLPSGVRAFAEPIEGEEAFIVREVRGPHAAGRPRDPLRLLADEQAALRRLAAAVAQDVPPAEILMAVAEEFGPLLGADHASVVRFDGDGAATVVAGPEQWIQELGGEVRLELDDSLVSSIVARTGRFARADDWDYRSAPGPVADYLRRVGNRSTAASPIIVEGRLWGTMVASTQRELFPADIQQRMGNFTELVGIVIANAESRAELAASRARAMAAADEARRRIQRDLHDGAQQRLVNTVITLKLARRELGDGPAPVVELLDEALAHAQAASGELRELAHGILPVALSRGGLRAGIEDLVSGVRLPVSVDVAAQRLPVALEATAYFILAEALTNVVRHARATRAHVAALVDDGVLRLEVRDDGVGGARCGPSSGLLGIRDRAAALNGALRVDSPPGGGTVVAATLPIPQARGGVSPAT
jgi:signal transduction histidine kinase